MHALSIKDLKKTYHNKFEALKGVSLNVEEGDFFALLGPNGAGKTTLIGIISSLTNKTSGSVSIFDKDLDKEPGLAKQHIGLVPQEFNCSPFENVLNIVVTQGGFYGLPRKLALERAEKYLKKLHLWDKRKVTARMLSGGMKRRLMIARALVHEPKLLILDEPTAGVDIEIRLSMWEFLKEINKNGTTIILTTHYLEEAENLCKHIAIINKGNIVEHTKMSTLLSQLSKETFILSLKEPLSQAPNIENYPCTLVDETTLEIELDQSMSMTQLFAALSKQNIGVARIRNKRNRLEELFVKLINEQGQEHELQ
jgi:ABC-2 type transport system ATP-binding protein